MPSLEPLHGEGFAPCVCFLHQPHELTELSVGMPGSLHHLQTPLALALDAATSHLRAPLLPSLCHPGLSPASPVSAWNPGPRRDAGVSWSVPGMGQLGVTPILPRGAEVWRDACPQWWQPGCRAG